VGAVLLEGGARLESGLDLTGVLPASILHLFESRAVAGHIHNSSAQRLELATEAYL